MDWLRLSLVLLAVVAGHINAQQGYNYPRPKTPFPGDNARDNRLPSTTAAQSTSQHTQPQGFSGSQSPLGSQQPSGGYNNGIQSPQQTVGGYSGIKEPETPGGAKRPFGSQDISSGYPNTGATNNQQTPFGTQQQSGGYPSAGQTGTASFRTQPQTGSPFLRQQPSTGYSGSPSGTQGPSRTGLSSSSQKPFGSGSFSGTQGSSETGTTSGNQAPFGSGSVSGSQRPSETGPISTQGYFGSPGSSQGPVGSQQTNYQGARPTTQDVSGGFPGERRPNEPSLSGPGRQQSPSPSTIGRAQYSSQDLNKPSTGHQEGYNYPIPQTSYKGNAPTGISEDSRLSTPLFRQSSSQSPDREDTFNQSGLRGTSQFPSGRESSNGYSSPGQTRPSTHDKHQPSNGFSLSGPQGSISSSRQSGVEQQNGYSQADSPQSLFPSPTTERQQTLNGFSASEHPQSSFPSSRPSATNQQTSNGYAQAGIPQSSFRSSSKYPDVESQYPSGNGQRPDQKGRGESSYEGIPSAQSPAEQGYRGPESSGFLGRQNGAPRSDSTEAAGKPNIPERPTGQFPINAPVEGQLTNGYSSFTQGSFPPTSQSKVGPSGYPQIEQRPLSSYLPPGVKGTGELPLSQFPSTGSQFPSGVSEAPRLTGNGYSGSLKPAGGLSNGKTLSGAQVPSRPLERSQNGFESVSTPASIDGNSSRLPSRLPGQLARSQNEYDVSRTPTGRASFESGAPISSRLPSGLPDRSPPSQNGYDVSRTPTGRGSESGTPTSTDTSSSQLPSDFPNQSPRSQNGYDVAGRTPFESDITGTAADQGQVQSGVEQGRHPTLTKSFQSFVRPGAAPGYGSNEGTQQGFLRPISGQEFTGFQQNEEGNFDEQKEGDYSAIPGQAGRDYPILSEVPETSFNCDDQEYIGYYADVETRCQIFHICANNKTYDFLCPNGTIFHQQNLVCVWWNQFECDTAPSLYRVNKDIYELSIVGAQQTGGIPVPGQTYPDLPGGGFGFGRQTEVAPDGSPRRPGGYRTEEGLPGPGIQRSEEYPRARSQESTGPSTRYSSERPQGSASYSSEDSQRPSNEAGGYPNERPQGSISPSSIDYSNRKIGNGEQSSQEYSTRTKGQDNYQTSTGDIQRPGIGAPIRPHGLIGSSNANEPNVQSSRGYPSARQGSAAYPNRQPQGAEEQRPLHKSGNGKSPGAGPQGFDGSLQKPKDATGFSSETPQGASGYQYPSEERQRTGTQRFGGSGSGETAGREPSYPSDRPTGPNGSQFSSPAQGPGQYKSEGSGSVPHTNNGYPTETPQDSGFSSGQERQGPVEYGPSERTRGPGVSNLPESGKYPSGTSSKPGFRTSGSPFSGASQPHQPTREYLPTV